jgi:alpha-N-arabinofuranosidase
MCNIAQIVNVLQSLLLTDGPEGKSCIRTTTYHAFALFKPHRSKTAVRVETQDSSPLGVSVSASKAADELVITFVNPRHDADVEIDCTIKGSTSREAKTQILHDPDWNACNTFDNPNRIVLQPQPVALEGSKLKMDLPRLSVATVTLKTT